jgi:hypothetical protein
MRGRRNTVAEKEWWEPKLTDAAWLERIRADYPEETQNMDDDALRDHYAYGRKYATTWDHTGDAYEQFEALADAYAALAADARMVGAALAKIGYLATMMDDKVKAEVAAAEALARARGWV